MFKMLHVLCMTLVSIIVSPTTLNLIFSRDPNIFDAGKEKDDREDRQDR